MDSLNTIPSSGSFGDVSAKLNDNFSKVGQSLTTLENVAIANKGYFDTLASLQAAFPSPKDGNIAYVANVASTTGYYIYNVVGGAWTASTVEAPPVSVPISNYAEHGYTGTPKSLKQVDDEVSQLAGEKVSSENIVHSVFERVDFSDNNPTLPDGFAIEDGSLVFTKAEGMSGNIVAVIPLNLPNRWKAGKYLSMRGASVLGNESTITLVFHNSAGVSMMNQSMGAIPKSGSRTRAIVNAYDSSTKQVKLNVSINSTALSTGHKVYLNDVVLTDVAINDFRGLIQVISNPALLSETIQSGSTVATTVEQIEDTVNKLDQNSLKLKPVGDALFNPYDIDGVGVNVAYRTPSTSYSCPPIPFNDENSLVVINCHGYALYDNEMGVLKKQNIAFSSTPVSINKVDGAEFVRLSTPLDNRFDARATYPGGAGYSLKTTEPIKFKTDSLKNGKNVVFKPDEDDLIDYAKKDDLTSNELAQYNSIEDFNKNKNTGTAFVGNIIVKSNKENHLPISNRHTQLDYDILNFDIQKPQGVITNRQYYPTKHRFLWYSYKTGRVYHNLTSGEERNQPLMSNSIEDFLDGVYVNIKGDYARTDGINTIRELDNGELLMAEVQASSEVHRGVYVSSGMNEDPNNLTWTKVIEYRSFSMHLNEAWGVSIRGNNIMISEYNANRKENSGVWYSENYGQTFRLVATVESLDVYSGDEEDYRQHIHGCCYDPYWDRLWIMLGEAAREGQHVLAFSDDKGVTWTRIGTNGVKKNLVVGSQLMKFCGGYAFPSGVIFTTDSQPNGYWRYNRVSKYEEDLTQTKYLEEAKRFDLHVDEENTYDGYSGHERTISHIGGHFIPSEDGSFYLCHAPMMGENTYIYDEDRSSIIYVTQDGVKFHEIYREENLPENAFVGYFQDGGFKSFALNDGRIIVYSEANPRFHAPNNANGSRCIMIGNMPSFK